MNRIGLGLLVGVVAVLVVCGVAAGQDAADEAPKNGAKAVPGIGSVVDAVEKATSGEGEDWSAPVRLAVVFAALALLPSALVMMTSFTRIVIVLAFTRRALSTQAIPPNIALIGLALFLTLFTMAPTLEAINQQAVAPYLADTISFGDACSRGNEVMKSFMVGNTRTADLELFINTAGMTMPEDVASMPAYVAIPAFAISEFRRAFEMGCLLFIPFLLIDLVVAGILLSAGMMMLPPTIVSMPFKIILFVLVDGWSLLTQTLVNSFQ